MHKVELKSGPKKFIKKLQKDLQKQLLDKIALLASNPLPQGVEPIKSKPELKRIRSGDYRIVYHIVPNANRIIITHVGHRSDIYKRM